MQPVSIFYPFSMFSMLACVCLLSELMNQYRVKVVTWKKMAFPSTLQKLVTG